MAVGALLIALALPQLAHGAATSRSVADPPPAAATAAVGELLEGVAQTAAELNIAAAQQTPRTAVFLAPDDAVAVAESNDEIATWIDRNPVDDSQATFDDISGEWEVSFIVVEPDGTRTTTAVAVVVDATGDVREVRTEHQVAWMMARGYEGAFGRAINRPQIWIPLMLLFLVAMVDFRRPLTLRTLDLLVLLSFSLSLIWFNRGEIDVSVPLVYPPLVYLAARLGWLAYRRSDTATTTGDGDGRVGARPLFTGSAPDWLLVSLTAIAAAYRYGLNAFDSNVIDVGYAGVIGADRILVGATPYGTFPDDCGTCDTYGPFNYISYVPFEFVMPWSGSWDALPAAHGAAVAFDLAAALGLLVLGVGLGGRRLGIALLAGWMTFPFTAFALANNANDVLVAAALIWGLVALRHPVLRGLALGLAISAKFTPAALVPLWLRHPFPRAVRTRAPLHAALGLLAALPLTGWVLLLDGDDGVRRFYTRTIESQLERESPFSIWGLNTDLQPLQLGLTVALVLGGVALARWPRRLDALQMIALSGLVMIAVELVLEHWFYLYIPWFFPFALIALVPLWPDRRDTPEEHEPSEVVT